MQNFLKILHSSAEKLGIKEDYQFYQYNNPKQSSQYKDLAAIQLPKSYKNTHPKSRPQPCEYIEHIGKKKILFTSRKKHLYVCPIEDTSRRHYYKDIKKISKQGQR
ncbi:hypothetical protein TNCV_3497501 [Trichonephila clavipes]|nr:hypothetical protein TNCV_3497501 [Trichonephila clavipes]